MDGNRFVFVKDLNHMLCDMDIDFLVDQDVWNRIKMLIKFHMVVDMYTGSLTSSIFVWFFRNGSQVWLVDVFKFLPPRPAYCAPRLVPSQKYSGPPRRR